MTGRRTGFFRTMVFASLLLNSLPAELLLVVSLDGTVLKVGGQSPRQMSLRVHNTRSLAWPTCLTLAIVFIY